MTAKFWAGTLSLDGFIILMAALLFGSLAATRAFLYQPFDIASASMEPTLNLRDYFLVAKSAYLSAPPKRGDVVVFWTPQYKADFVKRVVGLPGDKIQMKDGVLIINGVPAAQRRIADWLESCEAPQPCHVPQYEETLPGGRTVHILDRVQNGPADNTDVFVVPAGEYFVIGDNRDNSDDSRTRIGFVARGDIVGRAAYKFVAAGHLTWQPIN